MFWLGPERGNLSDWTTQRWVQLTGRRVDLREHPWLAGPVGPPTGIGREFFEEVARAEGLEVRRGGEHGLLADFSALRGPEFDPGAVHPGVADFYERTSSFAMDAWAEWCGAFRPFGGLLAVIFSRRLQQLNMPLSALDTSRGVASTVLQLVEPATGEVRYTAWVRELVGSGRILYAGSYSIARVPGYDGACVKVVFPLPNGNAVVLMRPVAHADGSFSILSTGERFGDPGFYFTVHTPRGIHARYLRSMRESIRVYPAERGQIRADHELTLWGATFLRIHYRLQPHAAPAV
jgi:hypothetical protein